MQIAHVVTLAVGVVAVVVTAVLWLRVSRKVRTEEHGVVRLGAKGNDVQAA